MRSRAEAVPEELWQWLERGTEVRDPQGNEASAHQTNERSGSLRSTIELDTGRVDVLGLVVGEGLRHTLAGVAIGGAIALVFSQRLTPLLFEVSPRDPAIYILVSLTLLAVGIAASAQPARRAARIDRNVTLRAE